MPLQRTVARKEKHFIIKVNFLTTCEIYNTIKLTSES